MWSLFFLTTILLHCASSLPLSDFFPYGSVVNDRVMVPNDDQSEGPFALPHTFPYFDNNHRQIWIANNGLFSFLSAISTFVPNPFPLADDQRLITGFWSDIDTRGIVPNGGNRVYYQIHSNTNASSSPQAMFTKANDYVRRSFPQLRPFESTMIITGTWDRVGAYDTKIDRLNTFQIVLATDGERSFVFLLYHDLQWAGPSYTTTPYAQAGFNAGDGISFEMLPFSRTGNIVRLVNESNVNIPGLFIFRVDTDEIDAGGCSSNSSVVNVRPRITSQLGSAAMIVQGPCFNNRTILKCRFGSSTDIVDGLIIDEFRALCLAPLAPVHGPSSLRLSIDNGITFLPASNFTYAPLQFGSGDVSIQTGNKDKLLRPGEGITLSWHFSESMRSIFPSGTTIDIELVEVVLNDRSELQQKQSPILIASNVSPNASTYRLLLPNSISEVSACFIRVMARFGTKAYGGLNTGILAVYSQSSAASEFCLDWSRRQPEPSTWNANMLPCPMTRIQAIAAGRCCYESDSQCYLNSTNEDNCWLHQARPNRDESSAVACYISKNSNTHGAGAECCYDLEGQLITRGTGAGTDDRYRPASYPVQHFFEDVLPYIHCCMIGNNIENCDIYMRYRPPRRGSNTMGESGGTWGDPHFITLDGTPYTFNGYGEYTYLAVSEDTAPPAAFSADRPYLFMSQIRTVALPSNDVTVIKGFAARSSHPESQPISITVSRRENLILRRGDELIDLEENINMFFYPEVTIEYISGENKTLILSWTIGVTIQIKLIETQASMASLVFNLATSITGEYRGRTFGLLGTYDGNRTNDLRTRSGTVIDPNSSIQSIHQNFGITWAINSNKSLFYYESHQNANFFQTQNIQFVPNYAEPTNTPQQEESVRRVCKIPSSSLPSSWSVAQKTCHYDMSVTRNAAFAQTSFDAGDEILSIKANLKNPPLFNPQLPVFMEGKENDLIRISIDATSDDPSSVVVLSADHLPSGASFNTQTKIFEWKPTAGNSYVRIRAKDTTYNLTATHDISFQIAKKNGDHVNQSSRHLISLFVAILLNIFFF